jgi:catechol 2,3-dioxygenase-like lactoylglutathione lyase family enzyme
MPNPFVHIELMSSDLGKAKTFYGKLFGWQLEDKPMGDMTYTMIRPGDGMGGGMLKNPMPGGGSARRDRAQGCGRHRLRRLQHHHRSRRRVARAVAEEVTLSVMAGGGTRRRLTPPPAIHVFWIREGKT